MSYWVIRQNPYGNTDQEEMRDMVLTQNIITCPYGHMDDFRTNTLDEIYNKSRADNWKSNGVDKRFYEEISVGDKILVLFSGLAPILAEIVSDASTMKTEYYTWEERCKHHLTKKREKEKCGCVRHVSRNRVDIRSSADSDLPFTPIARTIRIIDDDVNLIDGLDKVNIGMGVLFKKDKVVYKRKLLKK